MNLISAIKEGNEKAFRKVFDEYHTRLYFYVLSKTKSEYLAEETVQLTFIKFWNYREGLNEELTLYTQLFRIATTTLIDLLRKQNIANLLIETLSNNKPNIQQNDVFEKIDESEARKKLASILESMPPMRRKVFEMSRVEKMTYNEISAQLSISPKTVETHISLAIKQIRQYMIVLLPAVEIIFIALV